MNCLLQNAKRLSHKTYMGMTDKLDNDGFRTGEHTISYSEPVDFYASLSPASGSVSLEPFGNFTGYSHILVYDGYPDINEDDLILDGDIKYRVTRKAVSLNHVSLALQRL